MPRYIFDTIDGTDDWDDDAKDCPDRMAIQERVYDLIAQALKRQAARGLFDTQTMVFVHRESGGIVLSAYGKMGDGVQLVWTPGHD